nr:hypothetical protein [Planctomycetota bacterium]
NEVIAAYLEAVDAGETPDPKEFIAAHNDVAAELESFFANRDEFDRMAEPLQPAGGDVPGISIADSFMNEDGRRSRDVRFFGITIRAATRVRILGALFTLMGSSGLVESCFREELFGWWKLVKVVLSILLLGAGILLLLARVVDPKDN